MRLRVLTWNLVHGRANPGAGRDLSATLIGWSWDVALLQQVPTAGASTFAAELGCELRSAGTTAILSRSDRIATARAQRLRRWPAHRWVLGVQLGAGVWVCNLHAAPSSPARAAREVVTALGAARGWARDAPLIVGGALQLRAVDGDGLRTVAGADGDHVLASDGARVVGEATVPAPGTLSDHGPLAVTLELG